ncbi:MAG: DUF4388 domain-containing protein [Nannocystaceae bacterium]
MTHRMPPCALAFATTPTPLAPSTRGRVILSGELHEVSLAGVLHLASNESVDGWLEIPRHGLIGLRRGQVVDARCGELRGIEALRELLFHRGGEFVLARGEATLGATVDNVTFAIVDAYRLRDEWMRLRDLVLRPLQDAPWKPTGGLLDRLRVHLDGRRPLSEVVREGEYGVTLVLDAILDALQLGLLEVVPRSQLALAPEPAPEPEADLDYYEWIDRGRECLRDGDLDRAESALHHALDLRPGDRLALQNLTALAQRRRFP